MKSFRGFIWLWAIAAVAVLSVAGYFWWGWCNGACQSAQADADGWREQVVALDAKLAEQNAAVQSMAAAAEARIAAADEAKKRAEQSVAALAGKVQSLLAAKPMFADKPCESACYLLSQPL